MNTLRKSAVIAAFAFGACAPPAAAEPAAPHDRVAIIDAITAIAAGADRHQWDRVRAAFAPTITVDYTSLVGGQPATLGSADLVKSWEAFLPGFDRTQHLVANHTVQVDGDQASAQADFQATHRIGTDFWVLGGWYDYSLVRDGATWRVSAMRMTWTWETGDRGLMARAGERMKARAN